MGIRKSQAAFEAALISQKAWLQRLYGHYNHRQFVALDPLICLYDCQNVANREIVGLIASSLAYGQVKVMLRAIQTILGVITPFPADFLAELPQKQLKKTLSGFRYRFTPGSQMIQLLLAVGRILRKEGSLKGCFLNGLREDEQDILPSLGRFIDRLREAGSCDFHHLLPHPEDGSACKRMMLYLRWMVRCDAVDPGGWEELGARRLVVPLDTHMFQMSRRLGWTDRSTPNQATALQITGMLRRMDPEDPVKFDFAMTRPGIRGEELPANLPGIPGSLGGSRKAAKKVARKRAAKGAGEQL